MLLMMGVLGWLRRKHRDESVNLWLFGLLFILIEAIAVAVFRSSAGARLWTHVLALDAYLAAGATFAWAAHEDLLPGRRLPLLLLPAVPMFLLATLYGLDLYRSTPYVYITGVTLVLGAFLVVLWVGGTLRQRLALLAIHLIIWVPSVLLAQRGDLRSVVYWNLTCLYLLVALSFRRRLRRGQIGGVVIVAGFTIWAMCFFLHPMVRSSSVYGGLVDEVWNMQKFLVILGMVLTLLEGETERRKGEAMHDVLTGLPNRRLFGDRLAQALERSLRSGRSTALFLIDLDNFKQVNDTLGHKAGDLVLQAAAQQLQSKVRSSDTLARCGGDEFCVIVNELTRREDCDRIALALAAALGQIAVPGGALSGSIGYAVFPQDAADGDALFATADSHMYQSKRRVLVDELPVGSGVLAERLT